MPNTSAVSPPSTATTESSVSKHSVASPASRMLSHMSTPSKKVPLLSSDSESVMNNTMPTATGITQSMR